MVKPLVVLLIEDSADTVLQMDDEVALLQFGEVDVECGAGGECVWRFQPTRTLDFVTAENFSVGNYDEFGVVTEKTAGKRADMSRKSRARFQSSLVPRPSSLDTPGFSRPRFSL